MFELAFTIMFAACVPVFLWPYACRTVIYVLDRLPTRATFMQSTAFVWIFGQAADVNNLRTFGCDAYVHLPDGQRKNDGLRAKKGILIGYDEESLGYIFYDPRSQGITITGHVSFNEDLSTKQPKTAAQQLEYDALQEAFSSLEGLPESTAPTAADIAPLGTQMHLTPPAPSAASVPDRVVRPTESLRPTIPPQPAHLREDSESDSDTDRVVGVHADDADDDDDSDTATSGRKRKSKTRASGRRVSWDPTSSNKKSNSPSKSAGSFDISHSNVLPEGQRRDRKPVQDRYSPSANFSFAEGHKAMLSNKWYDNTWERQIKKHIDDYEVFMHAADLNIDGPDQGNNNPEYEEAMGGPERDQWIGGMQEEIANLGDRLECWKVVHGLSKQQIKKLHPLRHKWVFRRKWEAGRVAQYRSRLTIKGCGQKYGVNFTDTFSPVADLAILRMILALGVTEMFFYWKVDVSNAFPNAELDEEIYMYPPKEMGLPEGSLLRLLKALYGLKQASRLWHKLIARLLLDFGYTRLLTHPCVFFIRDDSIGRLIIIVLYVDDFTIASKLQADIDELLSSLRQTLKITDGPLLHILGYRVTDRRQSGGTIRLDMDEYADMMLQELAPYIPSGARRVNTPMRHGLRLSREQSPTTEEEEEEMQEIPYRSVIGKLMYFQNALRLDLSHSTTLYARFMDKPGMAHWQAVQHILKRVQTEPHAYLEFRIPDAAEARNQLIIFVDSNWAAEGSTLGFVIFLNGAPIVWSSRKQKSLASSTGEAEVKAAHGGSMEGVYLCNTMQELGFIQRPMPFYEDNSAALQYIDDQFVRGRMKHIDMAYQVVKEYAEQGYIAPIKIESEFNVADGLTKAQEPDAHSYFCSQVLQFGSAQ